MQKDRSALTPRACAQDPAGQPQTAISSAEQEYPILERLEAAQMAAAREQAQQEGKVLCPWCLRETGEFRQMVFRDMPNGRHYYCTKCGHRLGAD
jgi:DNA-directed RNA polymerase subunit M/transcription elongation factor TFIIS